MAQTTFRQAAPADIEKTVEIIVGDPNQVVMQVVLKLYEFQSVPHAKKLFQLTSLIEESWRSTILAEKDGKAVGVLQVSHTSTNTTGVHVLKVIFVYGPRFLMATMSIYGPSFLSKLKQSIALQNRVKTTIPVNAYKISELHVAPKYRGQGIGGHLLDYAEQDARSKSCTQMALQVTTNNPAQQLYKRYGFTIVETRTNEEYEARTGSAGNHLMVKDLH